MGDGFKSERCYTYFQFALDYKQIAICTEYQMQVLRKVPVRNLNGMICYLVGWVTLAMRASVGPIKYRQSATASSFSKTRATSGPL